jgi:DNA-3-methyladenine glycosylase II
MGKKARLAEEFGFTIEPLAPYSFELTAHKPAGWPLFSRDEAWQDGVLHTALHLEGLLLGLRLSSRGTVDKPVVAARCFAAEMPPASVKKRIKQSLTTMLGANFDLSEFYRMAEKDPVLKLAVRDLYGLHNTRFASLFAAVTLAVTLQMAPIARSNRMQDCLIKRYGDIAVFDRHRVACWPGAPAIARADVDVMFKDCSLGYRAKFLAASARKISAGGFPDMEQLAGMSAEEAKKKIMELPGIGDYSADIINPHGGFSIDVWSSDIFGKLFFGANAEVGRSSIERIKAEGIKRWGKWARLAFVYVVHDLPNISRRTGLDLRLM